MPIAVVKEQLGVVHGRLELAGGVEVALDGKLVSLHDVNLKRHADGPTAAELGRWNGRMKQQRSSRAGARLRQHLRRRYPKREAPVDELGGKIIGRGATTLDDRFGPDFVLRVAKPLRELWEYTTLVEIGNV